MLCAFASSNRRSLAKLAGGARDRPLRLLRHSRARFRRAGALAPPSVAIVVVVVVVIVDICVRARAAEEVGRGSAPMDVVGWRRVRNQCSVGSVMSSCRGTWTDAVGRCRRHRSCRQFFLSADYPTAIPPCLRAVTPTSNIIDDEGDAVVAQTTSPRAVHRARPTAATG
uniref:Uncharacterized protein n=1 Tax=Plectus sambesii TaxID=2011161 RepID=A0A914WT83_9BILA